MNIVKFIFQCFQSDHPHLHTKTFVNKNGGVYIVDDTSGNIDDFIPLQNLPETNDVNMHELKAALNACFFGVQQVLNNKGDGTSFSVTIKDARVSYDVNFENIRADKITPQDKLYLAETAALYQMCDQARLKPCTPIRQDLLGMNVSITASAQTEKLSVPDVELPEKFHPGYSTFFITSEGIQHIMI